MEIREFEMSDDDFIDMIGFITPEMSDEEVIQMIDEIDADNLYIENDTPKEGYKFAEVVFSSENISNKRYPSFF